MSSYIKTKSGKRYKDENNIFYYKIKCESCGKIFFHKFKRKYCNNCLSTFKKESQKLSIDYVRKEFEKIGYTLLSENYINNNSKLKVKCNNGHIYYPTYNNFKKGERCLYCSKNSPVSWENVLYLFNLKGWKVLTKKDEFVNANTYIKFSCKNNHIYRYKYVTLKSRFETIDCPYCNKTIPIKFDDIKKSFEKEGWIVHTKKEEYKTQNTTPIDCTCPNGHRQFKNVRKWRDGRRCIYCNSSGPEISLRNFIEKLKIECIYNDRKILNGIELDFYFPKIKKAIEFNGEYWHCRNTRFSPYDINKNKGLYAKEIWIKDRLKKIKCRRKKIDLMVIWDNDWKNYTKHYKKLIKTFLNI